MVNKYTVVYSLMSVFSLDTKNSLANQACQALLSLLDPPVGLAIPVDPEQYYKNDAD